MIKIRKIVPIQEDAQRLIRELDSYQLSIYPEESAHLDAAEELSQSNVYFIGAYNDSKIIGIGAIKYVSNGIEYGEIKRVFVSEHGRGKGISRLIMAKLEGHAADKGIKTLRLETGIYQPEAIGLYERLGYTKRGSFGSYPEGDPYSVFMEKILK
jgi:putative acetyltransferase